MTNPNNACVVFRICDHLCAVPVAHAVEIMRPLRIEAAPGAPDFVRGISIIRDEPIPIVDGAQLLGAELDAFESRCIVLRTVRGRVGLLVRSVIDVRPIPAETLRDLPPLAGGARDGVLASITALDAGLVFLLEATRLIPPEVWQTLQSPAT